jgi:probable HAF family extracellular repeat protein
MRLWTAWVAVALLGTCVRTGRGEVRYSVTDLGVLMGAYASFAAGINNAGVVVGGGMLDSGGRQAYVWAGGIAQSIDFGPGDWLSLALHVNSSGQIVGWHGTGEDMFGTGGFLLNPDGTGVDFWPGSYASSVSDSGQVVGFYTDPATGNQWGFSWAQGVATQLSGPRGLNTVAVDVNSAGQIAGYEFSFGGARSHACIWQNGMVRDLGALTPDAGTVAYAVNEAGSVAGSSYLSEIDAEHATIWFDGTILDLGTLGGKGSAAHDINGLGQVVGHSALPGSGQAAFIWRDGAMIDLNTLVPADSGWSLVWANGINDSGQIVGSGYVDGYEHAYLLTPVPEPLSLCLVWVGLLGLLKRGWR